MYFARRFNDIIKTDTPYSLRGCRDVFRSVEFLKHPCISITFLSQHMWRW